MGRGRKKGAPLKKTLEIKALAEKLGVNPFEILLYFASNNWAALGYESGTKKIATSKGEVFDAQLIEPSDRINAAKEACKYLFPQRKAVELSDSDGNSPFQSITDLVKAVADAGSESV